MDPYGYDSLKDFQLQDLEYYKDQLQMLADFFPEELCEQVQDYNLSTIMAESPSKKRVHEEIENQDASTMEEFPENLPISVKRLKLGNQPCTLISQPEESRQFIIKGTLQNNVKTKLMVDSGSFANLIDNDFLRSNYTENEDFLLKGGAITLFNLAQVKKMDGALKGHTYESSQGVELEIDLGFDTQLIKFFIIEKQVKNPPIILGLPFIRNNCSNLNWKDLKIIKPI